MILAFVGVKMILSQAIHYHMPTYFSLPIIALILVVAIASRCSCPPRPTPTARTRRRRPTPTRRRSSRWPNRPTTASAAMAIVQDDVDRLRATVSIVDVVGEVVQLRRVGRNWVGLCPFHAEKTPVVQRP